MNAPSRHEEIERETGLAPTEAHRRGEARRAGSSWPNDVWILKSPLLAERPVSDHLLWLDQTLRPHLDYFRSLVDAGVEIDLFCGYRSDCDHCGFSVNPEALALAHDLGVQIEVSVIVA